MIGERQGHAAAPQGCREPCERDEGDDDAGERRVRALVVAAQAGDRDAMQALYVDFAPLVHAHVSRFVANRDDAEDVTQHTFAKLITELARYEPGAAPFRAWLLRVARNVAIDDRRRVRAFPYAELDGTRASGDDGAIEARASLCEALSTLTEGQRDVLILRHLVGLTPEEIATRLGRSLRSVYCLHHRGRAIACSVLDELGSAPATATGTRRSPWHDPVALEVAA